MSPSSASNSGVKLNCLVENVVRLGLNVTWGSRFCYLRSSMRALRVQFLTELTDGNDALESQYPASLYYCRYPADEYLRRSHRRCCHPGVFHQAGVSAIGAGRGKCHLHFIDSGWRLQLLSERIQSCRWIFTSTGSEFLPLFSTLSTTSPNSMVWFFITRGDRARCTDDFTGESDLP